MVLSEEERKQRHREAQNRFRKKNPEYVKNYNREYKRNHTEEQSKYNTRYYAANREKLREYYRERHKRTYVPKPRHNQYREETCDILTDHHESLKDDPDRLTTEFIVGMVEKKNER